MVANKKAFTLIEILVAIVVIAVMATIVSVKLFKRKPESDFSFVLNEFNNIIAIARQEAIANQKVYRVSFKSNKESQDYILIEQEYLNPEKIEQKLYKEIKLTYAKTKYVLPEEIKFYEFFQNKKEIFEENRGQAFCFVTPTGLVQPALIHVTKKQDENLLKASFNLLPFFGKFEFYDGFIKPGQEKIE